MIFIVSKRQSHQSGLKIRDGSAVQLQPMKRISRCLFNGLAVLSLLLCVGMVLLWIRSTHQMDSVCYRSSVVGPMHTRTLYSVSTTPGSIEICKGPQDFALDTPAGNEGSVGLFFSSCKWYIFKYPSHTSYLTDIHASVSISGPPTHGVLGFGREIRDDAGDMTRWISPHHSWRVSIPIWFFTALFGALPITVFLPKLRRRRFDRLGLCVVCGYDLRATPERCPECGMARLRRES